MTPRRRVVRKIIERTSHLRRAMPAIRQHRRKEVKTDRVRREPKIATVFGIGWPRRGRIEAEMTVHGLVARRRRHDAIIVAHSREIDVGSGVIARPCTLTPVRIPTGLDIPVTGLILYSALEAPDVLARSCDVWKSNSRPRQTPLGSAVGKGVATPVDTLILNTRRSSWLMPKSVPVAGSIAKPSTSFAPVMGTELRTVPFNLLNVRSRLVLFVETNRLRVTGSIAMPFALTFPSEFVGPTVDVTPVSGSIE